MYKKLAIITVSALFLGGCTLTDVFKSGEAAKDENLKMEAIASTAPESSPDTSLETIPYTSTSSDVNSIEADVDSTVILEEDFSDLE